MEELEVILTLEEIGKAIDSLIYGKAPGNDGIPRPDQALQYHHFAAFV